KIIHLDPEDKNFFSLKADHLETNGSAKKLSLFRAYTIQHWLIDQGIAENRMEIKGWGGKKMIYDKHDSQADKNVRVEIEITADQ
ncbi:MAG: OmpA family protein, partial [Bacteroidota bacterium]